MRPELVQKPRTKATAAPVQTTIHVVLDVLPASVLSPRSRRRYCVSFLFLRTSPCISPPPPRRCARGVPPDDCCSARLHTRGPRSRHSCAHLPNPHRPFRGPFGNALTPLQPRPSLSSPRKRFEIGDRVRALARTTSGVRSTHAIGILSAAVVGIEGSSEYLFRAGGADHANSRRVSDEVMVPASWDDQILALMPIASDRRVSWFIEIY